MKNKATIGLVAALCLGSSMTAFAAPETMPDGKVFDAEYYAQNNPDVVEAFGTSKKAMYRHYVIYGEGEGRLPYAVDVQVQQDAQVQPDAQTDEDLPVEGVLGVFGAEYRLPTVSEFEDFDDVNTGSLEVRTMTVSTTVDPDFLSFHLEQLAPYTAEGYEWRPIQVILTGEYIEEQGHWWPYYHYKFLAQHSDGWEEFANDSGIDMSRFEVTQDGETYTECRRARFSDQVGEVNTMQSIYFLVPKNYTGNLVYIISASKMEGDDIIKDETNAVTYVFQ